MVTSTWLTEQIDSEVLASSTVTVVEVGGSVTVWTEWDEVMRATDLELLDDR